MRPLTVMWRGRPHIPSLQGLLDLSSVERVVVVAGEQGGGDVCLDTRVEVWDHSSSGSSETVRRIIETTHTPFLLEVVAPGPLSIDPHALERMTTVADHRAAVLVYGDYTEIVDGTGNLHPLAAHQPGSFGEGFALGPTRVWAVERIRTHAVPARSELRAHGWYDLRLKAARVDGIVHLPESVAALEQQARVTGKAVFDYLTVARSSQVEAEQILTAELRSRGALLAGPFRGFAPKLKSKIVASIVIPVRDRLGTVADAVGSALEQDTAFDFDVIVVDNHSTDGTTALLAEMAKKNARLVHVIPRRRDLGIGGCWNEAIFHPACGRYAVQLDSDDLYSGPDVLTRIVETLQNERCGMLVGSYSTVDFDLNETPPGLVDHREWSEENGPNNALRVDGLGAPRAFATELVRRFPFPNVSYGEDYAVALRICREYRVGRIYESLYHCRRWPGNTDADSLALTTARRQEYKDRLRTLELAARQRMAHNRVPG